MFRETHILLSLIAMMPVVVVVLILVFDTLVRRAARSRIEAQFRKHYHRRLRRHHSRRRDRAGAAPVETDQAARGGDSDAERSERRRAA